MTVYGPEGISDRVTSVATTDAIAEMALGVINGLLGDVREQTETAEAEAVAS